MSPELFHEAYLWRPLSIHFRDSSLANGVHNTRALRNVSAVHDASLHSSRRLLCFPRYISHSLPFSIALDIIMPSTSPITIVDAAFSDFSAIARIYSYYVSTDVATFEIEPPDHEVMFSRAVDLRGKGLPYLAAYKNDKVVGYAYASEFRPRAAYRLTVENSVYVDHEFRHQGVGKLLLAELVKRCTAIGKREIIAIIAGNSEENAASRALHEGAGFRHVGTLPAVGLKFDRYIDDIIMQLSLQP